MQLRRLSPLLALLALLPLLAACADIPKTPEAQAEAKSLDDPLEPMNRAIFDVNDFLDRLLIRPLTELYRFAVPDYARDRVANIVSNFDEPVIFANNLMQGRLTDAGTTAERLAINSTLGVGGIFEVADGWGMHKQMGDFGQTLSVWGINGGPYLVLPLFGPSNFRDAIGLGVDMVMSPWQYLAAIGGNGDENRVVFSEWGADGLTRRDQNLEGLDALRAGSLDFYAEMRSVYKQYRDKQLGLKSAEPAFEYYE
ncbi:MAG: VacJ family lipoprotein [Alphaproteobacteria bacterium]